jgi:hypothetical protein
MFLFKMMKKREPRKFNYKGRYRNADEEHIRREKILHGDENTTVEFSDRMRHRLTQSRKAKHIPLLRIAIMAGFLAALLYFLMK